MVALDYLRNILLLKKGSRLLRGCLKNSICPFISRMGSGAGLLAEIGGSYLESSQRHSQTQSS